MRFTIDAELTVDVSLSNIPAAVAAVRRGDFEALLDRVDVVDTSFDVRR